MIKATKLRGFAGKDFLIKEVYNKYRAGWTDNGTTKKHYVFKYFPVDKEQVLINGTPEMEEVKKKSMDNSELREQIWNKETKQFEFHRRPFSKEDYKLFRKVFDVVDEFKDEVEVEVWKGDEGRNVIEKTKEVMFSEVPSSRIKDMINVLVDKDIPTEERKDKTGKTAVLPKFDYEDEMKNELKGKFCKFKVTGAGLDTTYTFLPGKEFSIISQEEAKEIDFDSIPF